MKKKSIAPREKSSTPLRQRSVLIRFTGESADAVDYMIRHVNFTAWVNEFALRAKPHIEEAINAATKDAIKAMAERIGTEVNALKSK